LKNHESNKTRNKKEKNACSLCIYYLFSPLWCGDGVCVNANLELWDKSNVEQKEEEHMFYVI
jgi:hypothetical protein